MNFIPIFDAKALLALTSGFSTVEVVVSSTLLFLAIVCLVFLMPSNETLEEVLGKSKRQQRAEEQSAIFFKKD